jgi:hypothetical protein
MSDNPYRLCKGAFGAALPLKEEIAFWEIGELQKKRRKMWAQQIVHNRQRKRLFCTIILERLQTLLKNCEKLLSIV